MPSSLDKNASKCQQFPPSRSRIASDSKKLPFGLEKILGEPDNLIPTDLERKIDLRLTSINSNDLNETKEKNMEGYNEQ